MLRQAAAGRSLASFRPAIIIQWRLVEFGRDLQQHRDLLGRQPPMVRVRLSAVRQGAAFDALEEAFFLGGKAGITQTVPDDLRHPGAFSQRREPSLFGRLSRHHASPS